jgi:hypothetical protein
MTRLGAKSRVYIQRQASRILRYKEAVEMGRLDVLKWLLDHGEVIPQASCWIRGWTSWAEGSAGLVLHAPARISHVKVSPDSKYSKTSPIKPLMVLRKEGT